MSISVRQGVITRLAPHQVFVFGTNTQGFHGAGAAGMAWRGPEARGHWKTDDTFCQAMRSPPGDPRRTRHWAVLGVAQGPMQGRCGKSYGLQTIVRPGLKRSFPLDAGCLWTPRQGFFSLLGDYRSQVERLRVFAAARPQLEFLVTISAAGQRGLSGYFAEELHAVFDAAPCPENLILVSRG